MINIRKIGYARVSTDDQNLDLQIQALEKAGCEIIFKDIGVSGGLRSRPGLDKALKALKQGDKLVVWRLDRLGRSLSNLIELLTNLGTQKVSFQSLCEYIDTSTAGGKLIFHIMGALAEFERGLISERTRAGMAAAAAKGKHVGRPPVLNQIQRNEVINLISLGESHKKVALRYGVSTQTLSRLINQVSQ